MIKPFKFLQGRPSRLYQYSDRTINPDLYGGIRFAELSDRVQQIVSHPNYEPANYIEVNGSFYDTMVIRYVRSFMRGNTNWRGYEEAWMDERNEYVRLKILGGINIGASKC